MAQLAVEDTAPPSPYFHAPDGQLFLGDCREVLASLPAESVHCVITSPLGMALHA